MGEQGREYAREREEKKETLAGQGLRGGSPGREQEEQEDRGRKETGDRKEGRDEKTTASSGE